MKRSHAEMTQIINYGWAPPTPKVENDALPNICRHHKCLNTAIDNFYLCQPCLEESGGTVEQIKEFWTNRPEKNNRKQQELIKEIGKYEVESQTIYFIRMGNDGPVKIGVTQDILDRVAALQTGNPFELQVISTIQAPAELEKQFHAYFDEHRMMGEWFQPVEEVLEFAKLLNQGNLEEILDRFEARIAANN